MSASAGYVKLNYVSGGSSLSVELKIKSAHGLDDPERAELWPELDPSGLDGSLKTQFEGFRRLPLIDLGVISSRADRIAVLHWLVDNDRTLDYNTGTYFADGLSFVPAKTTHESEWKFNIQLMRGFVIDLKESTIRATWPDETPPA